MYKMVRINSLKVEAQKEISIETEEDTLTLVVRDVIANWTEAVVVIHCNEIGESLVVVGSPEEDPVAHLLGIRSEP